MDLTPLFAKYPFLREAATAFVVIFVDIVALVILLAAARERHRGDRGWAKEGHGFMLACEGEVYPLGAAEILIGRHPSADIRFSDSEVSRFHALLSLSGGKWQIEDIGAQNGVAVNGHRISKPCTLRHHDAIMIGKHRMVVIRGTERA
ncbi:MAG: FHA domain-containing protein [Oscillospiraceae bacterium]|nr:FHA domain-containing protein [Oscillospiraceae bacterium]MCR4760110.1 FHA domain-containing protein [Oscillospiraceae bacterium]